MRENREARRSPVGVDDDAPPSRVAGWCVDARSGREGKAMSRKPEMNGRRESDSRVVPAKLANKAERSAAELVEGRRLDEGNTGQQNALRTQSREASSALDRVRRVARKDRDARFTALLHHVSVERLRAAYQALSPKAAAGVDEVTWQDYGNDLEGNLGICMPVSTGAPTGRSRHGGCTSRRRTGGCGRSVLPRWRTRSSSAPSSRY